jgi:hypothetical protein
VDYLFDAAGRFVTAMPKGWQWGPAELDPAAFSLVRTDDPTWEKARPELQARKKLLADKGLWQKDNIYSAGRLEDAPEAEHVTPPVFINLRTGSKYPTEADAWASARDGDTLFYTKGDNLPDCPGVAIRVISVAGHQAAVNRPISRKEAEKWSSST